MNTTNTQDSRKTIIAFAAGLLIGALLVWAFTSATPEADRTIDNNDDDNGLLDDNTSRNNDDEDDEGTEVVTDDEDTTADDDSNDRDESFSIDDQSAGNTVKLGNIDFPDGIGWVAVSDYENGVAGNFLGAARYDVEAGLEPTEIELLRATEEGKTYRVSFFDDNGDLRFSRAGGDVEVENRAAFFTAE